MSGHDKSSAHFLENIISPSHLIILSCVNAVKSGFQVKQGNTSGKKACVFHANWTGLGNFPKGMKPSSPLFSKVGKVDIPCFTKAPT